MTGFPHALLDGGVLSCITREVSLGAAARQERGTMIHRVTRFERRASFIGIAVFLLLAMMGIACDAPPDGLDAPREQTATASTALTTTFPVTFDSTAVSATLFNLYPATTGGFVPNVVTTEQLEASAYQFCIPAGGNCFDFTVNTDGSLAYGAELDTFVSGRGTSTLQVRGFPVTIDATAIHVDRMNIAHGEVADGPNVAATYSLVPGGYDLCVPAENNCFAFTVSATGQIDYEASRDTYLAGRGSSTLTVGGFAITVDASSVSADRFNIDFGGVGTFVNAPVTVTLVPGSYNVCVPSSNNCFDFSVALDGALDFAHTLDGYVSGRGLRALTIVGFPITFDATAVTADRFNVDFGSVGTAAVSAPMTYSLVPGVYSMCVPASNNCFAFSVSLGGLLGFSASLDGFVSGRNTGTLTVRGFPITIDATGESATTFNVDFGSVGTGPNQATTFSMVPGIYVVCVPASNNCVLFSVTPGGTVDFEAALDSRLSGRGTPTLFIGRRPVAPPPTVACVGQPGAPVTLTAPSNACGVAASGGGAGACASGNAGPVTCSFDGHAAETLGAGAHTVVVVATGSDGQTATCSSYVNVVDATAPLLNESPSPSTLWPPNHKLVPIDLHLVASDNCALAGPATCSAASSEAPLADGSGHTSVDIVWTDGRLYLRAERSGAGPGRTYTIHCTATDTSGNITSKDATVTVAH
jgi:hypothetical protein